jgi:hypothetical protein
MDTKQLVRNIVAQHDPDIDTSEGSGITDILINPLANILEYYQSVLNDLENFLSVVDLESLSTEDLDAIASTFLLTRRSGSLATGYVKIGFSAATNLTVQKGQQFKTSDGKLYQTTREYSITAGQMSLNIENNYFLTGAIPVGAMVAGDDYTIGPNEINEVVDPPFTYLKVFNTVSFSRGGDDETNEAFYERLVSSATSDTSLSKLSFQKIISDHYDIKDLDVKGFGDTEMVRDVNYNGVDLDNYEKLDFFGKVQGNDTLPQNQSIAGAFILSGQQPPDFLNLSLNEFDDVQYEGIYRLDDALFSNTVSTNLLNETFSEATLSTNWLQSDGELGYEKLQVPEEISIVNSTVKLGISESTEPNIQVVLDQKKLNEIIAQITKIITSTGQTLFR